MAKFLRGLLGGNGDRGRDADFLPVLEEAVAGLPFADPSQAQSALGFVLEGRPADLPGRVRTSQSGRFDRARREAEDERRAKCWRLYDRWDDVPPLVLIRFGEMLAATSSLLGFATYLDIAEHHPWIDALVEDLLKRPLTHVSWSPTELEPHPKASMGRLEALLSAAGLPESELVVSAFRSFGAKVWSHPEFLARVPGFAASAARHADLVRPYLLADAHEHRAYSVGLLGGATTEDLLPFSGAIAALVTDGSNRVRVASEAATRRLGSAIEPELERLATHAAPETRILALTQLWSMGGQAARVFVQARATSDAAPSVRQAVIELQRRSEASAAVDADLTVPTVEADFSAPLGTEAAARLHAALKAINDAAHARWRDAVARSSGTVPGWKPLTDDELDRIVAQVRNPPPPDSTVEFSVKTWVDQRLAKRLLCDWALRPDVTLGHVVVMLQSAGRLDLASPSAFFAEPECSVFNVLGRAGRVTLLDLAAHLEARGVSGDVLARDWMRRIGQRIAEGWTAAQVWPYLARHRRLIDDVLDGRFTLTPDFWFDPERVFDAIATFPRVPADLVDRLFGIALGSGKSARLRAQRILDAFPGRRERLVAALASGKAESRANAAQWLGRLRDVEALSSIEAALAKEKHDQAAAAMMGALEALGASLDRFLDRDKLATDARAGLKKGIPKELAWFPADALPVLHWADGGEPLAREIPMWWLVQACKGKTPEPSAVLRRHVQAIAPAAREALGETILSAWLAEDVRPIPHAEAVARARAEAIGVVQSMKQYPQFYETSPDKGRSEDEIFERRLPAHLMTPAGSVIGAKGILSVVSACGGAAIAGMTERYLKVWYGHRAAQGKALIQMLAWVDHPSATQLMLSVGSRFRTKGFQDEANRQAALLAERRGWTLEELADRTIPTAGFDEDGTSTFDYGDRAFTARLTAELGIELFNEEGRSIANLPEARKDEDAARVAGLRKQFSAAKKELKSVVTSQRARLHDAMCTQRAWAAADWSRFLGRHPILRRHCQRLVWRADRGDHGFTFRPLEDGSLTNVDDEVVTLGPDDVVRVAHEVVIPPADSQRWIEHLRDYDVAPLLPQFGKPVYRIPAERVEEDTVQDFLGHVLMSFALRGRATKLGWLRGPAEDAGFYFTYVRRFPSAGLEAVIEFTGSALPEENRLVALRDLSFRMVVAGASGRGDATVPLGQVPPVLLSECWNDLRTMAADGTGFDPEWERKTG